MGINLLYKLLETFVEVLELQVLFYFRDYWLDIGAVQDLGVVVEILKGEFLALHYFELLVQNVENVTRVHVCN